MKQVLIFLCLGLASVSVAGKDYLDYYRLINVAERQFVNGRGDSALANFDRAFEEFEYIFPKDALVAAQIAWSQQDTSRTVAYLLKGARYGLRSRYLDEVPVMKSFTDTRLYNTVYEQMREANDVYGTTLAPGLRAEWMNRHSAQVMAVNTGETGDFVTVVRENVARIRELLKEGTYPSEKVMGLVDETAKTASNMTAYWALANYECVITELHDPLWEAVRRGELHPREFASLWEWEYIRAAKSMKEITGAVRSYIAQRFVMVYTKDNSYVTINRNCTKEAQKLKHFNVLLVREELDAAEVDRNREEYYIQALETDRKKLEMEQREGFRFFWGMK